MSGSLVASATQAALTSHYRIAGRTLRVEAPGDWAAHWVANFLSGFHLVPTTAPLDQQTTVTLRVGLTTPPAVPVALPVFAINHGDCHTDGSRYFLTVNDSLVLISPPSARLVEVWFGSTPHAKHPIALVNVFSYALQAALRRAGVYDVHAAGLLDPASGRGALFVGPSGSGKTTFTLKLTESGWRYISDDMIVLRETDAGLEAEGLRRLFSVAAPSLAGSSLPRLDEALGAPVASDPRKRRLEPSIIFPDGQAHHCRPGVLFFPQVTDTAVTAVNPMSAREAMQQLMRSCPWATYDEHTAEDYLRVLARLANQCRSYELRAGRDLMLDARGAADVITPYMAA